MKDPAIVSTIKDEQRNITYHVYAYRSLTRDEMITEVKAFINQRHRPKLKDGQIVIIKTIIGG